MPIPVVHQVDADIAAETEEDDVAEIDVAGIADDQVQIAGENDIDRGEQQALAQLDIIGDIGDAGDQQCGARDQPGKRAAPHGRHARDNEKMPRGNAIRQRTKRENSRIGIQLTGMNGVARPSKSPSATPPSKAPAGLPSPPSTVTTKLLSW